MPPSRFLLLLGLLGLSLSLAAQSAGQSALVLLDAGKPEEARRAAAAAIATDPGDSEAYLALTLALLALGRPADAEVNARSGLAKHRDGGLYEALGEACHNLGKNEEALRNLQMAVALAPEGPRTSLAFYYMGETYLRLGRYGHADIAFTAALVYDPGRAPWWARLGWAREKAGDTSNALLAYQKALDLDARLDDARLGRDRLLAKLRG
jgi:tetratricopeptide (TPR) repeat protein